MKKAIIASAVIAILAVAGYFALNSRKTESAAVVVTAPGTIEARKGAVSVSVEGASILESYRQVTLRATSGAVLMSIKRTGEKVEKGGAVAIIDTASARNALSQAELLLSQAELEAEKADLALVRSRKDSADTKALVEIKAASQDKLTLSVEAVKNAEIAAETAAVKVKLSRLALERSRREVQDATIAAPFAGTVLKTFVAQGDLLGANAQVALFGDISRLALTAEVDEFDIGKIAVGQGVTISGDSIGAEPIQSVIESISPMADIVNNISIFTVTALVDNDEGKLRPGMSADFSILIKSDKGLVVPSKSVSTVRSRSYIEVLENGEIVKKRVEIGADDGVNLVVLSGVDEGAQVVVPGALPVSAIPAPAPAAAEKSVLPITIPGSGGTR